MPLRYYRRIVDTCEPYLIARPPVWDALARAPLGVEIPSDNVFDPQAVASGPFLNLVKHLDELTFGPLDLAMPSWVFYDCAVVPGAIFGFATRGRTVPPWIRRSLSVPDDYDGLVPMSLFIAIPTASRACTLVYSLASINQVAPGAAPEGLLRVTLAAGTASLQTRVVLGTTRWRSPRLALYAGLGPLELVTAWASAHVNPATLTFRAVTDDRARRRLLRGDLIGPEGIDSYLDADDFDAMAALQRKIERGMHAAVVGPSEIRGAETRVPLQLREAGGAFAAGLSGGFTRRFQG